MAKVIEIAVSQNSGKVMKSVDNVESIAGKGLLNDRHFRENNEKKSQITLIEIENINYYNKISGTSILPKDFRRNIITEVIKLNDAKDIFPAYKKAFLRKDGKNTILVEYGDYYIKK